MEELKYLIPVVSLIIGWLLNEFSQRLRMRSSDRRAIARALADLLEIRHQTFGMKAILDEFGKRYNLLNNFQLILSNFFVNFLPSTEELHKRYDNTVDAVASADPVLGYQLRSKDILDPWLRTLRTVASNDATVSNLWPQFESQLMQMIKSPLEEAIRKLSRQHGLRTCLRVNRILKRPFSLDKEIEEYLNEIDSHLKSSQS
jgi:hypothetical protein